MFFSHIKNGSYIALYSPPQASELFYLCKVLSCETATTSISDANNHTVWQGMKYIWAHYWKKLKRQRTLSTINCFQKNKFLFFLSKYFILMYLCQRNSLLTLMIVNFYLIVSGLIISSSWLLFWHLIHKLSKNSKVYSLKF